MHYRLPTLALASAAVLVLSGCASGSDETSETTSPAATADATAEAFTDERCAANESAGEITFATGYYYQASVGILNVLAAEELGYFDDLCLDVTIQPGTGDTAQNTQLLAANTVQFTGLDAQGIITAADNGIDILGISVFSEVGLDILMTPPDVSDLTQLDGTVLGQKGMLPTTVAAMLINAGVDVDSIEQVTVGYDPSVLTRGQVDSLTGFISNEPNQLEAMGEDVTVWRPYDFGVPSSMGVTAVNPTFAADNPTAVEDFIRGMVHAYHYCADNGEECVGYASAMSGPGYEEEHNLAVWTTEVGVIDESVDPSLPMGAIDPEHIAAIHGFLAEFGLVTEAMDVDTAQALFDSSFTEAVHDDGALIWPSF